MIRLIWFSLLALQTGLAAVWWWMAPGGYPSSATEFWVNQFAPPLVVVVFLVALLARGRFSEAILPPVLAAIPLFWMAFGIAARIVFPESWASLWNLPFIGGAVLVGLWVKQFRFQVKPVWLAPTVALLAALAGWHLPDTLHAPVPGTQPNGGALPAAPSGPPDHKLVKLSKDAQLHPGDGRVVVKRDNMILNVQPMLSFSDRSPDGCTIGMAPEGASTATARTLEAKVKSATGWTMFYKDEDQSVLEVTTTRDGGVDLDARSRLGKPIFSHVNSYADLALTGHKQLTVAFSPAPRQRIEPAPATGAARFAYVDAAGMFHVMEAASQNRGPFRELAAAPLKSGEPLTMTIYDGDKAMFTVAFADWAAQASTQLSPTAGGGVPVDVIELVRQKDVASAPVLISMSLADTSIGGGTQTVGHAAGVYRDRISIRLP